jgi:5-formyltetrahydrofolate cyclo-ligase
MPDPEPRDAPDTPDDAQEKQDLRVELRSRLASIDPARRREASQTACMRLLGLDAIRNASVVMLYLPLATELDVTPVAIRSFQHNQTVCVPKVDWARRDMSPIEISSFDDHVMDIDEHGLRTPRDGRLLPPNLIDLIVVPALAYDLRGRRLGRGGGYYDRFLPRLRRNATLVGLAFDEQIIDEVPVNDADVAVDIVITDRRIAHVRSSRSRR